MSARHPAFSLVRLTLLALVVAPVLRAAEDRLQRPSVDDQDAVTIRGIFDFQLPKIVWPKSLRVSVNPVWRDFLDKDNVRMRVGARYAFNSHFELSTEALTHFENFGGNSSSSFGVAEYRLGGKWTWSSFLKPYVDTAVGFNVALPAPGAPVDLNIGTARYSPYVVFSRELKKTRGLNAFLNLGYEAFDSNPGAGRIADYRPARDNFSITPGVVLHRAPWHYTFATSLRTTAPSGEGREFFSVLPSVSWEVPKKFQLGTGGRWIAGGGYEAVFFGDEIEHRVSGRLKWEFDWGKAVRDTLPWPGRPGRP